MSPMQPAPVARGWRMYFGTFAIARCAYPVQSPDQNQKPAAYEIPVRQGNLEPKQEQCWIKSRR